MNKELERYIAQTERNLEAIETSGRTPKEKVDHADLLVRNVRYRYETASKEFLSSSEDLITLHRLLNKCIQFQSTLLMSLF